MSNESAAAIAAALATIVTATSAPLVASALRRGRILDVAGARSSHTGTIPRGGGLAVAAGVTIGSMAMIAADRVEGDVAVVLLVSAVLGVIGLADDLRSLPALTRLAAQVLAASAAAAALIVVGATSLLPAAIVAFWLVFFVNAFNFMDGIDGISGTIASVVACSLALAAFRVDRSDLGVVAAATAGASLGFLPSNVPRARLFLGDVGSYLLGSLLALSAAAVVLAGAPLVAVSLPMLPYAADVSVTLARRVRRGDPPLEAHREHTYQRLAERWGSHLRSTSAIAALAAVGALAGHLTWHASRTTHTVVACTGAILVCVYVALPWLLADVTES